MASLEEELLSYIKDIKGQYSKNGSKGVKKHVDEPDNNINDSLNALNFLEQVLDENLEIYFKRLMRLALENIISGDNISNITEAAIKEIKFRVVVDVGRVPDADRKCEVRGTHLVICTTDFEKYIPAFKEFFGWYYFTCEEDGSVHFSAEKTAYQLDYMLNNYKSLIEEMKSDYEYELESLNFKNPSASADLHLECDRYYPKNQNPELGGPGRF